MYFTGCSFCLVQMLPLTSGESTERRQVVKWSVHLWFCVGVTRVLLDIVIEKITVFKADAIINFNLILSFFCRLSMANLFKRA